MNQDDYKIVNFFEYCAKCKHEEKLDKVEPCNECLDNPVNQHSDKPVKFEPKTK